MKRHNEIRDLTAAFLQEVATCIEVEPNLQQNTGEVFDRRSANVEENSRLDVKCKGFWNAMQEAFFDVWVFNPLASIASNRNNAIPALFKANECAKRRSYEQRVMEVEYGSFTQLVFAATGGMGPATTTFYKRLASMIAKKAQSRLCKEYKLDEMPFEI